MGRLKGFTLLELLIVLAIIGLGSALLIPRLNSDVKLFDAQVRDLVAIFKYSRRMAVIKNQIQRVVLHPPAQIGSKQSVKPVQKNNSKKGQWYSKGVDYIWNTGSSQNELKNKQVIIDFFPQGGATEGELLLYSGVLKSKITIDGFTGRVVLKNSDQSDYNE
ncbi:MAG: type II secretion system protein [Pseudomonadota bacterium]